MIITVLLLEDGPFSFTLLSYHDLIYDGPIYLAGDSPYDMVLLNPSTGYDENGYPHPVAVINGECPVASDTATWGRVKAVYRDATR